DATPYNIQWNKGKLVFIDTLSFEKYDETPWIAYRQFCESFLGPLLIMHYSKMALPQLLLGWPEGIPLPVIQSLLPGRSRFSFHTYLHIHLHAKISAGKKNVPASEKFSKQKLLNLISSLEILINKLKLTPQQTAWSDYYDEASQRKDYLEQKKKIIDNWIKELPGIKTAADLGANEGEFSKLLASKNIEIIAADFDSYCINKLYNEIKKKGDKNIQPLVLDISNPSPSIGVNNEERMSFIQRTKVDMVLALAVIHHLAIGKNIPFSLIAEMFGSLSKYLIIEFIPKEDPKVKAIFLYKKDIYKDYNEQEFIRKFESIFIVSLKQKITGTNRTLFLMMRK
ncbi:MAG: hypothetical protein ABUL41_01915, partial [Chitinophagaceae bacterium]